MSAILRQGKAAREPAAGTLGGLLYADASKARVTEADWVVLVHAMARGEAAALRALYARMHRLVFTLAFRLCGNHATADEITVDVFHDLWRTAGAYDPEAGTVVAWVMNRARSRSLDRIQHDHRRKRVDPCPHHAIEVSLDSGAPLEHFDRCRLLASAFSSLTPEERSAIQTAYFGEMSYAQAAQRLGQPLGTIKTRIRSALAKLRDVLTPQEPVL